MTQCDTTGSATRPNKDNECDLVIIGAGPAGMTASIYAVRANLKVLLLDKLAPGGQVINTLEIHNYPGTGVINRIVFVAFFPIFMSTGLTFS